MRVCCIALVTVTDRWQQGTHCLVGWPCSHIDIDPNDSANNILWWRRYSWVLFTRIISTYSIVAATFMNICLANVLKNSAHLAVVCFVVGGTLLIGRYRPLHWPTKPPTSAKRAEWVVSEVSTCMLYFNFVQARFGRYFIEWPTHTQHSSLLPCHSLCVTV